jgi:predicted dehydrogenase
MSSKLGVAIVGAGFWGKKLVLEYLALSKLRSDVQLRWVVDSDRTRLTQLASELNLPRNMLETEYRRILEDETVGAVHLAVPNELHFPIGMAALEARRHVLLEKPMALNMRDAVKLARKAEQQSVVLHVGHIFRFNNAVREAKKLLDNGTIGKPLYYGLDWEALLSPPRNRDIVFDLGPHPIDVLNYLSNEWPTRVVTLGKSFLRRKPDQEEVAETVAEFEGDIFAQVALSWLYMGPRKRLISVTGEFGTILVDALNQRIDIYTSEGAQNHHVQVNDTILTMITHFVESILNREPPQVSGLVGAMTVAVLAAMRESMSQKAFVSILSSL